MFLLHNPCGFNLPKMKKYSAVYRIGRIFIFRDPSEVDGDTQHEAKFILPEIHKLAMVASTDAVVLLFFTTGMHMLVQSN